MGGGFAAVMCQRADVDAADQSTKTEHANSRDDSKQTGLMMFYEISGLQSSIAKVHYSQGPL